MGIQGLYSVLAQRKLRVTRVVGPPSGHQRTLLIDAPSVFMVSALLCFLVVGPTAQPSHFILSLLFALAFSLLFSPQSALERSFQQSVLFSYEKIAACIERLVTQFLATGFNCLFFFDGFGNADISIKLGFLSSLLFFPLFSSSHRLFPSLPFIFFVL
jgi:hypothetical protein